MSSARKPTKRVRKSPQELLDAVQQRLDATPERLARAKEAGETPTLDPGRTRRLLDPFDTMRANRVLAPNDPKLNDIRWLVGESLRRTHHRARLDQLRAVAPDRMGSTGFGPRHGLPQSDVALQARDRLREAEDRVGPHAWPIVTRIVIEGAGVRECRGFVPELATPWRADAVVSDRLRVALDMIGGPRSTGIFARRGDYRNCFERTLVRRRSPARPRQERAIPQPRGRRVHQNHVRQKRLIAVRPLRLLGARAPETIARQTASGRQRWRS